MALLPCFPHMMQNSSSAASSLFSLDVLPMKTSSSVAVNSASSISGTIAPSSLTSASLAGNVSNGPVVQFVLYHPSLLKIEADFPNVISVQEIPCNHFFALEPSSMASGPEL